MPARRRSVFLVIACALLVVGHPAAAAPMARTVPETILEKIRDDDPRPLPRLGPRSRTAASFEQLRAPDGPFRAPAEYEPEAGLLMRWGSFNDVLAQIVVGVTTGDPLAWVHLVVNSRAQEAEALKILETAGAVTDRIAFIRYHTDSPWMRDYGPRVLASPKDRSQGRFQTKSCEEPRVFLDHTYNLFLRRDDLFPTFLANLWGGSQLTAPLIHAGGNFHVFADGDAFATARIRQDNPGLERWRLAAWFLGVAGLDLTIFPAFPADFDASGHIDMWMLPAADRRVIVGRYPERSGEPHDITEEAVADLSARGYTVFRTPGWSSRGIHFTYTNAVIFNDLVFVPVFERYRERNGEALSVYQEAFPGKQLIPIECTRPLNSAGALHCLVMHIPKI